MRSEMVKFESTFPHVLRLRLSGFTAQQCAILEASDQYYYPRKGSHAIWAERLGRFWVTTLLLCAFYVQCKSRTEKTNPHAHTTKGTFPKMALHVMHKAWNALTKFCLLVALCNGILPYMSCYSAVYVVLFCHRLVSGFMAAGGSVRITKARRNAFQVRNTASRAWWCACHSKALMVRSWWGNSFSFCFDIAESHQAYFR